MISTPFALRRPWRAIGLLGLVLCLLPSLNAAVFQYHTEVEVERRNGEMRSHDVLCYIPPESEQIRGVIMAGRTLMEVHFSQDPRIRQVCRDNDLALIFMNTGLQSTPFQNLLDHFAEASGYTELASAPVIWVGHSAGGPQAHRLAANNPDRTIALIQYRGGMPTADGPVGPGIPTLAIMGQFDEFWGTMRNEDGFESWERALRDYFSTFRAADQAHLGTFTVEPGAGHFGYSQRCSELIALFIDKAVDARVPETWSVEPGSFPELLTIDHTTGWLTSFDLRTAETIEIAPYADYTGDRDRTSWHFDEEMARAVMAFHQGLTGRQDQFIRWENRTWVDAGVRHFFLGLDWVDDGATFQANPVYANQVPGQHNGNGPRWLNAGEEVGHADVPIILRPVGGPIRVLDGHRLQIWFDELNTAGGRLPRITFLAYSPGDETYRPTEQVGMGPRGMRGNGRGADNEITFSELSDMRVGDGPQPLAATSSAELPVHYYVAYGPAEIIDGQVVLTEVPQRASFPIEVQVTAWQFGSAVNPRVRTASPVSQTFQVLPAE